MTSSSSAKELPEWGYRPHLDGLRAVAVYLVVAFHAGSDRLEGGFIGVDVFFVLSGYLVTQVVVKDLRTSERLDFRRFYSRRFRRLLPAAAIALVVTAVAFSAVASPAELTEAAGSFRAAFLYYANWYFIAQSTEYFAAAIENSPVVHFWSLAIEEQFYLAWPLLLSGLHAATRKRWPRWWVPVRWVVALFAIASATAALVVAQSSLTRAYYGTDTRAYQLLAGAFLALTPELFAHGARRARVLRLAVPVLGLSILVLATSYVDVAPITRGVAVAVAVSLLVIAIEGGGEGITRRLLSCAPVVYLGKISYGTYLWHWPVIVIAVRLVDVSPVPLTAITCLVATGIASLSYQLVERPIRESQAFDRHRSLVIAGGLAVSAVAGLALMPAVLEQEADDGTVVAATAATTSTGSAVAPASLDWEAAQEDRAEFPDCLGQPIQECIVRDGGRPKIMLMGDSHARMLLPAFERLAEATSSQLIAAVRPVCPWQEGLAFATRTPEEIEACRVRQADWYDRLLSESDPDIVVAITRPLDDPVAGVVLSAGSRTAGSESPDFGDLVREHSERAVEQLIGSERRVVIIEPIPSAVDDPLVCISSATSLDECRYVANARPTPVELVYRDIAASTDGVWSLDIDGLVCPYAPICDPVLDGLIVKRDVGHLTGTYAATLGGALEDVFRSQGILE